MLSQIRIILSVIIIIAALLSIGLLLGERLTAAADGERLDLPPIELPSKGNPKLDSQLNQLVSAQASTRAANFASESNTVRVVIECLPDQIDAITEIVSTLGEIETSYRNLIQVVVPVSQLTTLADVPSIRLVRMPRFPKPAIISEGVQVVGADEVYTFGYTGAGVKVAILDSGFTGYLSLLGTELPVSVTTQSFYNGSDIEGDSYHGTACAEIVYDIAPDAHLYLVNFHSTMELGDAVDWLIAVGVDVISFSMGDSIGGPGDGSGPICEMVDAARAAGILWISAIGNEAQEHWQGDFIDTNADGWHEFDPGIADDNSIWAETGDQISVDLKWDDLWGSSANDYDLYLFDDSSPYPVDWSDTTQDGDDTPTEWLSYTATYSGWYHIAIGKYYAIEEVNFHLYCYNSDLQYRESSSSFCIPADSPNAIAVGAVPWYNPMALESFSSRGPTKDGRIKPDLVAPDSISTATYGLSDGIEYLSGGTGFYGTSASTPHIAGVAALLLGKNSSWDIDQVRYALESTAIDLGTPVQDNLYGWGLVDAYTAIIGFDLVTLESIAAEPSLVSLEVEDKEQLTVTATYSDDSMDDVTADATYVSSDGTVATVSNTGVITAIAEGDATITVSYTEDEITETALVSVTVIAEPTVLDYYRGQSGDTEVVETTDLLNAANDWANAVVPPGFTESISTTQLLALANEWATTK